MCLISGLRKKRHHKKLRYVESFLRILKEMENIAVLSVIADKKVNVSSKDA